MTTRLVSFLGLGPRDAEPPYYQQVRYQLPETAEPSSETPLVERALQQLLQVDSLVVLGTSAVEDRWIESGLFEDIVGCSPHFTRLPSGEDEEERWEVFRLTLRALTNEPLQEAGEQSPPDVIILDVTHGFRLQPMLGLAAVNYALSEWARRGVEDPPTIRVLYGAFEARDKETGITPIWDLTEFVVAARWNAALNAFMRFGRADDLEQIGGQEAKRCVGLARAAGRSGPDLAVEQFPRTLGLAARKLADDLALARTKDAVCQSAPTLLRVLSGPDSQEWRQRLPLLDEPMTQLREMLEPMSSARLMDERGLQATVALAGLYEHLQRYSELAATLREALVTCYGLFTGRGWGNQPGEKGFDEERDALERAWSSDCRDARARESNSPPTATTRLEALLKLSNKTIEPRNDVQHGGFKSEPMPASTLRRRLGSLQGELAGLVGDPSGVLINLTNHPVSTWPSEQVEAARDLGLGEPTDLPDGLPLVPPDASGAEVEALAEQITQASIGAGAIGACVQGEHTLSFLLVATLHARGVRCFTATSHREAELGGEPDGSVMRRSRFRFVRWREYPRLVSAPATVTAR